MSGALIAVFAGGALAAGWGPPATPGLAPVVANHGHVTALPRAWSFDGGAVLVHEDGRRGEVYPNVYAVRFDAAGARLDATGVQLSTAAKEDVNPFVACQAARCLVTWAQGKWGLASATFDPLTGAVGPVRMLSSSGTTDWAYSAVGPLPTGGFLVLWSESRTVFARAVDVGGVPTGAAVQLATGTAALEAGALSVGPSAALATWVDRSPTPAAVRSRLIDFSGAPLAAAAQLGTTDTWTGQRPSSVWDGAEYDVVWTSEDTRLVGRKVSPTGAPVGAADVTMVTSPVGARFPAVALEGTELSVVWGESGGELRAARFRALDLAPVAPSSLLATSGFSENVTLASLAPGRWLAAFDDRSGHPLRALQLRVNALSDGGMGASAGGPQPLEQQRRTDNFPAAVWTGAQYLSAHGSAGDDRPNLISRPVSALGQPQGTPAAISDGGVPVGAPLLAFDGQRIHALTNSNDAYYERLSWRALDAQGTLLRGPLTLTARDTAELSAAAASPRDGSWAVAVFAGIENGGTQGLRAVRLPTDGGLPALPAAQLSSERIYALAAAGAQSEVMVVWQLGHTLRWSRLSPGLTLLVPQMHAKGYWFHDCRIASDGREYLITFAWGYPSRDLYAFRVDATGARVDAADRLVAAGISEDLLIPNQTSVAYDGESYRIAYALDRDAGVSLWWRRFWPDGGMDPPEQLTSGLENAEHVSLVEGSPGRLLLTWREYDAAAGALRARVQAFADVAPGGLCESTFECRTGVCQAGRCCANDAGCATPADAGAASDGGGAPDAGLLADGGVPGSGPLRLAVGCGCGALGAAGPAVLLGLLALLLRRTQRQRRGEA